MAMNKIERLDREIQKTREKITEYQNKLKRAYRAENRSGIICKSSSLCGLCALPRRSLPPCCPATQSPVWRLSPQTVTPKNRRRSE